MSRLKQRLSGCDFVRVEFALRFLDPFGISLSSGLRLRRELRRAARDLYGGTACAEFRNLFEPMAPVDPVLARTVQKPAPAFVLQVPVLNERAVQAGEEVRLPVVFFGEGLRSLPEFSRVLGHLGNFGFYSGQGRFELCRIEGVDLSGGLHPLWSPGTCADLRDLPLNSLRWWLENGEPCDQGIRLRFLTPARLISGNKPLFHAGIQEIFPFVLRRVGSVLGTWCRVEISDLVPDLREMNRRILTLENGLEWVDWKTHRGSDAEQDLGGLQGSLVLGGEMEEGWVDLLRLGSLMNLGKGASFGAGSYSVEGIS